MKIIGAILVVVSGLLLGVMKANSLKKREEMLLELKKLMLRFKTQISFSSFDISELIVENKDSVFCKNALSSSEFTICPSGALIEGANGLLKGDDLELYKDFARGIGTSDKNGQIDHIELYSSLLAEKVQNAQDDRANRTKLFIALGLFCGIIICLIII